jgi:hypothetical protein
MPTIVNKAEVRKEVREAGDTMVKAIDNAAAASRKTAFDASDAPRGENVRSAENVRRVMEATSRNVGQKNAETAEQRLQKGADALRNTAARSTEAVVGAVADATRQETKQATNRVVEQLGQMSAQQEKATKELTGRTQQNLSTMMQANIKLVGGFQSVMREWADYTRNAVQCNIDGVNSIMRARTLQDLMAAQSNLLNAEMHLMLTSSAKISQATAHVAKDVAQSIGLPAAQQRN